MIAEVVRGEENLTTYEKHIAMIVENREDTFWKTVYESARAEEKEIPVVTVLSDSTQSTRECYVGINSYHLGQTFGKQVLQNVTSDMLTVCVNLP